MKTSCSFGFTLLVCSLAALLGVSHGGVLVKDFYHSTCPQAKTIVQNIIWSHVATNPKLPAKLLRLHFHDCFVRGCDGSVLINSTATNTAEKDAPPNLSLAGFDVIEEIKAKLESVCPKTVSCADILALAARDSVSFQYKQDMWDVLTGRRDGNVSLVSDALSNLPSPFLNITQLKQSFASKGLSVYDLVVLSGGHTIGVGHCSVFSNRLYNFTGKGDQDPSLNWTYAARLKSECSPTDTTTTVEMDPNSSLNFDSHYFVVLQQKMGLFQSDAALMTDAQARGIVSELVNPGAFFPAFAQSMKRMGAIGVLTGNAGEIRNVCGKIN